MISSLLSEVRGVKAQVGTRLSANRVRSELDFSSETQVKTINFYGKLRSELDFSAETQVKTRFKEDFGRIGV